MLVVKEIAVPFFDKKETKKRNSNPLDNKY
jgi:hypothetical protein